MTSAAAAAVAAAVALTGCGGGGAATTTRTSARGTVTTTGAKRAKAILGRPARFAYHARYELPAPLRDPAFAALGGERFVLLGGLDSADVSTAGIELIGPGSKLHTATLPVAQHDAQGARLGRQVYVFGGGTTVEQDHILAFNPADGAVRTVGALPRAASDVTVAASGGTAYIVGGFDGVNWLDTILAWRPGSPVRVVGHLPVGLRYAAATAVDGQILIMGGSTPTVASNAIYRFDPATGHVRQIGRLPQPTTHGTAATLGSFAYLIGGRGNSDISQTSQIWSINPRTGGVRLAGNLPQPLSDTAVVAIGRRLFVAGGLTSSGGTAASVGELTPAPAR